MSELVIKKVINAEVYLIVDRSVIDAVKHDVPVNFTLTDKKELKILQDAINSEGEIRFCLVKKKEEEK